MKPIDWVKIVSTFGRLRPSSRESISTQSLPVQRLTARASVGTRISVTERPLGRSARKRLVVATSRRVSRVRTDWLLLIPPGVRGRGPTSCQGRSVQ